MLTITIDIYLQYKETILSILTNLHTNLQRMGVILQGPQVV